MKTAHYRGGGVAILALWIAGCGQAPLPDTRAADEAALRELDAQWSKTAGANDLEGTVAFYADDAYLLPPNAPMTVGKKGIRESWASLLGPNVDLSWEITKVEVARAGDLAYLIGAWHITKPVADHGKLLEVWKKQADGKWKVIADTYNSDLPPAPAAK